ncbi:MAG: hypothetical protein KatS3mg119_1302 [Rhodothalassiaceae bacterium]|nr:MAG: hypothetical protein KatS3mg119_1302 [Rhodothalassiaceae bacterium]
MRAGRMRTLVVGGAVALIALAAAERVGRIATLGDAAELTATARAQETARPAGNEPQATPDAPADRPAGAADREAGMASSPDALPARSLSRAERDIVADLEERRKALEEREAKLRLKEQVLAATEQRIQGEIKRLETIKAEIERLVASFNAAEDEKLGALVKVYESMKPKDAAPIFERLDLDIQERLARQMKAAKVAALMASMSPEAAKTLTARLAKARRLPEVDTLLAEGSRQAP